MILALLQARMSSTRLPGKVMQPILGKPMILHQIDRIGRSKLIDKLILATSDDSSDDDLAKTCKGHGATVFRGSLNDVLDRFYQAALPEEAEHILRLTGDCPITDPGVIDKVIQYHLDGNFEYTSNVHPPTWPDGLDVEVFRAKALEEAWLHAHEDFDREHATPWIYKRSDCYLGNLESPTDLSKLRWTVDEPEDLVFIRKVFEGLYPVNQEFNLDDVLDFINTNPNIQAINERFWRNAGSPFPHTKRH